MTDPFELPRKLVAAVRQLDRPAVHAWLARLPETLAEIARRWELALGPPFQPGGTGSWVAPASTADGQDLVLKVTFRHTESEHELEGRHLWGGRGTVRVHRAEKQAETVLLLLERAVPGHPLTAEPEERQDEVVAGQTTRMWVAPPPATPSGTSP